MFDGRDGGKEVLRSPPLHVDVDGELCVTETNKALKSYAHKTLWSKNI